MLREKRRFSTGLSGFVSACLTALMAGGLLNGKNGAGSSALWLILFALCWWGNVRFWERTDKRMRCCFGILGAFFVFCCAMALRLDALQYTGWDGLALSLGIGLCAGPAAGEAAIALMKLLEQLPVRGKGCRRPFALAFAVLLLCYLPYVIAFFPGITGYDMDFQVQMITTGEYSSHHPLLHTLFIGLCMKLGEWLFHSVTIGYGIHTVLQTVLLAAAMAYALQWLSQRGCSRALWWGILAFFALSPQHGIMAVSGTKDILFSAAALVLAVEVYRFFTEPERAGKPLIWMADVLLLVCAGMLRKNMIYGLVALLLLCVVFARKALGKRFWAFALAGMLLAQSGMSILAAATNAENGSIREVLCVPFQQLARIHELYGLDEPVGYEAREVMPFVDDYSPERADHVKRQARVDTPERLIRFIKLWLRESVHYPIEYIDAFLLNCKGFWSMEDTSFTTTYDLPDGTRFGCMVVTNNDSLGIDFANLFPAFHQLCMKLFQLNGYMNYPVLWSLLHPALYSWLLLFGLAWAALRKNKGMLITLGVLASYLLTLLAGPCALIRYSYYLMLAMPVLLCAMAARSAKEEQIHV